MTDEDFQAWVDDCANLRPKPRLLRSRVDPIVVYAIPRTYCRNHDWMFAEGAVVWSDHPGFPVGYYSFAWCMENFDPDDGYLTYERD